MMTALTRFRSPAKLNWWRASTNLSILVTGILIGDLGHSSSPTIFIAMSLMSIFACYIFSLLPSGEEYNIAKQEERTRIAVSELATEVGFEIANDWSRRLDELMQKGNAVQAVREYRHKLGVNWDEANDICWDWPKKKMELELRAITTHIRRAKASRLVSSAM